MNFGAYQGWKDRTKKTTEKQAARKDMAEIRAARAEMESEKQKIADAQIALEAERLRLSRLRCPCCDGDGTVTAIQAEHIYRAFERLPSESRPDPEHVASLAAIAQRQPVHGRTPRIVAGVFHPVPVALVETATMTPSQIKKPSKANRLTDDGALIELD